MMGLSPVVHHPPEENDMNYKILLLAQFLISFMMAALMSGIMSLIALGPTVEWLHGWPREFITAWPIAFVLSLLTSRMAFAIAHRVLGKQTA